MRVHVRHEWWNWNNIADPLFDAIWYKYEYVPHDRMYETDVYITWQDVMGNEALGATVRNIPLIVVQHGAYATVDYLPEISYKPIADKYCVWGRTDAEWLQLVGVHPDKIHITGTPVINSAYKRKKTHAEQDRQDWLDFISSEDRLIVLYGPDHGISAGGNKNFAVTEELLRASQEELQDCLLIMKVHHADTHSLELMDEYVSFKEHIVEDIPMWAETIEGRQYISTGGLHAFKARSDKYPNVIFTGGRMFPQERLFSCADVCVAPNMGTFTVKAISNDIPVIIAGKMLVKEETHSFQVHNKKPYILYIEEAKNCDAIDHCENIKYLSRQIEFALSESEYRKDTRRMYAGMHAGPIDGSLEAIMNVIGEYDK